MPCALRLTPLLLAKPSTFDPRKAGSWTGAKNQVSETLIKAHFLSHSILVRCSIFLNKESGPKRLGFEWLQRERLKA